MKIIDNDIPDS